MTQEAALHRAAAARALRVLVLEESAALAAIVADVLAEGDVRVRSTGDAAALADDVDAIVVAGDRPDLADLLAQAARRDPDLPVLVITADNVAARAAVEAGARAVLLEDHVELLPAALQRAVEAAAQSREQRRIVERLKYSEMRFRAAIEGGFDAFILFDAETDVDGSVAFRVVDLNSRGAKLLGGAQEEIVGKLFHELVPADALARVHEFYSKFRHVYETAVPFEEEFQTTTNGWLHYQVVPLLSGVAVTARDVTHRKESEAALRESEARFLSVVQHVPGVVFMVERSDDEVHFAYLSDQIESLTGLPACAFFGADRVQLLDVTHADDRERMARSEQEFLRGEGVDFDFRVTHVDGSVRWVHMKGYADCDPGGTFRSGLGVMVDITERKRADEELRIRDRAIESMTHGVVILDAHAPEMPVASVNHAFEELTGYSSAELVGRPLTLLNGPETSMATLDSLVAALDAGEPWVGEIVNYRKDGTPFVSAQRISPVHDENGVVTHFISIHADETPRRRLEEQVMQAQKMEAVGRLAGGVAHDFNNVLLVIRGYSHVLMSMLGEDAEGWTEAKEIESAATRASELIRQLLAFSRSQVLQARVLDLNEIVIGTQKLLEPLIGEDIELHTSLDVRLGTVKADATQVEQALVNLAVNARDAMPRGGRLLIGTRNVVIDDRAAAVGALPAGTYSALSVEDTGHGMDAATQARIFEPFFSTKSEGKGTGLGLSTVYGVVKQSGGDIVVSSVPGEGTTITIYLPHARDGSEHQLAAGNAPSLKREETVLLVEDDDKARQLVGRLLRESGYDVHEAARPDEALRFVDQHDGRIHLLVSDVVMPQMSGPTLAKQVLERRPDTRVMFVSGYIERAVDVDIVSSGADFLQKPFTPAELIRTVRRVLDKEEVPA